MKKIGVLLLCLMLVGISAVSALPQTNPLPLSTGSFEGSIGFKRGGNWTSIGAINGTYDLRHRGGRFIGEWTLQLKNTSVNGTIRGAFHRPYFIGRALTDDGKHIPIVGFLYARNNTFAGRFMAPVGPALYFKGTFT